MDQMNIKLSGLGWYVTLSNQYAPELLERHSKMQIPGPHPALYSDQGHLEGMFRTPALALWSFWGARVETGSGVRAPYAVLPDLDRAALLVQLQLVVRIKVCSMVPSFLSHNLSLKGLRNDNRQEGLADVFQNQVVRPSCESSSPYAGKK